jgi:hypothetical protein
MIAKSFVATTKLSASSLSGLLFLVTGAGRVSIVGCRAGAGTASDFYAACHMNAYDQNQSNRVDPTKKPFTLFSHQFLPHG